MGMAISHAIASGMNGMRAAGDLVARMQTRGMKIREAKAYVAEKLKVSVSDLADPVAMTEVRQELNLGLIHANPTDAKGIDAKRNIANTLGIKINSVEKSNQKTRG